MRPAPEQAATPEQAAALVVALAHSRGLASAAEIEEQATILLSAFAVEWPDHPVARYFELADDAQIEAFFVALTRELRAVAPASLPFTIELFLN